MKRIVFLALAALVAVASLAAVASARSDSSTRVRGVVALKDPASQLVTLRAKRQAVALRVPGSMSAIRIGQRVELRGSTLRARGNGSRVLARNVTVASKGPLSSSTSPRRDDDEDDDNDELEIKGKIASLSPLTVASGTRSATCAVPSGRSLAGFAVGDFVEMTCDLSGGSWILRKIEREDDDDDGRRGDDDGDDDDNDDDDDDNDDDDDDDDRDDDDDDDEDRGHGDDD